MTGDGAEEARKFAPGSPRPHSEGGRERERERERETALRDSSERERPCVSMYPPGERHVLGQMRMKMFHGARVPWPRDMAWPMPIDGVGS